MAELFRKEAKDMMASLERTDKPMQITSPVSWLALIGLTLVVVATVIWAFLGTLPTTVSGKGIIASPTGTNTVFISETGIVTAITAYNGMEVGTDSVVLTYKTADEKSHDLKSSQHGTVSDVLVKVGDTVKQGSDVVRISPDVTGNQVVVCYVSLAQSRKIVRGDTVQVYLDSADSQTYGHMWARVVNIDTHAASTTAMNEVLGENNYLTSTIQNSGAVAAVTCELYPDEEGGYQWTNPKGKTLAVTNGSPATIKIIVDEVRPIEKMFSKLKEIWGE